MINEQYNDLIAELTAMRRRYDSRIFAATTLACAGSTYNMLWRAKLMEADEIVDLFSRGMEMALEVPPPGTPEPKIMTMMENGSETKQ